MCSYVLFWIIYLLSALQWIWILKRFFCDTWSRAWKTPSESHEINNPPYVESNYWIEVKFTFLLIAYLVLLCEFFWEFSIFHFCRPLVDIYWHPLLTRLLVCPVSYRISSIRAHAPIGARPRISAHPVIIPNKRPYRISTLCPPYNFLK